MKKCPVSYDSEAGEKLIPQQADEQLVFNRILSSLYFHYFEDWDILMVATTKDNLKGYTNRAFTVDTESRGELAMVEKPSSGDYINMVSSGIIHNCPVTPEAVNNANTIFGPGVASLKGETTRKTSYPVVIDYVEVLQAILDLNPGIGSNICERFMFLFQHIAADQIYHAW